MAVQTDPSVSFEPVGIDVTLAGRSFTIDAWPASLWLTILSANKVDACEIVPGLFSPESQDLFDDLLFMEKIDLEEVKQAVYDVISAVSGHPWWWTLGLVEVLHGKGAAQFLGEMSKLDATQVSFACWVNTLYALIVKHMPEKDRLKLDMDLEAPPANVELEFTEDDEKEAEQAFFSMMNQPGR